jgi:hypothetical protein
MEARTSARNEGMQTVTCLHTGQNCPMYLKIHTAAEVSVKLFNTKFHEDAFSSDGQTDRQTDRKREGRRDRCTGNI